MNKCEEQATGIRQSLTDIISATSIRIPKIQRDYAQGRKNQEEVRNTFTDKIFEYLNANEEKDLDFIFGNVEEEGEARYFIPIDGQQRLTTLALLYWYLANINGDYENFKTLFCSEKEDYVISKFTYETRTSSTEFFNSLFRNTFLVTELDSKEPENQLSKFIENQLWFSDAWLLDPTVQAVLTMLDTLHNKFKDVAHFYERLPNLKFLYLDLDENKLTDDLYIKMNSRGVSLKPFENFKAHFEQLLDNIVINKEFDLEINGKRYRVDAKKYFTTKIDQEWANIIWELIGKTPKEYDRFWTNLFRMFAVQTYASLQPHNTERIRKLLDKNRTTISFYDYQNLNVFVPEEEDAAPEKRYKTSIEYVLSMICFFDSLPNGRFFFQNFWYDDRQILINLLSTDYADNRYVDRLKFYAWFKYLQKKEDRKDELVRWMRVLVNLIENTAPYDSEQNFVNALKSIDQLIQFEGEFYTFIKNPSTQITGFDKFQIEEEQIKAKLILHNASWEELILNAEQHEYLKGQIGFLLFLSGIKERLQNASEISWNEEEDKMYRDKFSLYYQKTEALFGEKGLRSEFSKNDSVDSEFLFERALLTFGNYLIRSSQNHSFLRNFDRDISWKRFLKMDREEAVQNNHSAIIRNMFDAVKTNEIAKSLIEIIVKAPKSNTWKSKFISNSALLSYLGEQRFVRIDSNHGFVLFKGNRISGGHAELYSYDIYTRLLKDREFLPFTNVWYHFAGGEDLNEVPCAVLDKFSYGEYEFAIDVFYDKKGHTFGLKFFDRLKNHEISVRIKVTLHNLDYNYDENQDKYIKKIQSTEENDLLAEIAEIRKYLNTLNDASY